MERFLIGPVTVRKRSRLPHWDGVRSIYAVTFNLFDAIPEAVLAQLRFEAEARREALRRTRGKPSIRELQAIRRAFERRLLRVADEGHGSAFMRSPLIADLVSGALLYFDDVRYRLYAWCVMPNHVHVVFSLIEGQHIFSVLKSWKGFTAREGNRLLGRQGRPFWMTDYFDRTVRSPLHLRRAVAYALSNPGKAALTNWPYVRSYPERLAQFA